MAKFKKYVKRQSRRAWKAIKKFTGDRYGRGANQIISKGIPQMARDIKMLKSVINSEKLRYQISTPSSLGYNIGQIMGDSVGYHSTDITPNPTQGDGYANRTGSSIKLHSSNFRFQVSELASTMSDLRFKVMIFKTTSGVDSVATAVSRIFSANPFTGFIDYNSTRNPDYFKEYTLIRQRTVTIPMNPASISGQTGLKEFRIGMKYRSHHVRWDKNTTTIASGQLIMVVFCDSGNGSNTTAPTVAPYNNGSVPVQAINTGGRINYYIDHYYYDN